MKFTGDPARTRVLPGLEQVLEVLRKARAEKRLVILVDVARLNHPGSPVYNIIDVFAPPLVLFTSGITLLLSFGMLDFVLAMIVVLLWQKFGQAWLVATRLRHRAERLLLSGPEALAALWRQGGIGVTLRGQPERRCVAPGGDLRVFVADHLLEAEVPPAGAAQPV